MREKKLREALIWNCPISHPDEAIIIFPGLSEISLSQKKRLIKEYDIKQKFKERSGDYQDILHDEIYGDDPYLQSYRLLCWKIPYVDEHLLPNTASKARPEAIAAGMIAHTKCSLLYGNSNDVILLPKKEAKLYEVIEAFTILGFYPPVNLMWDFSSLKIDEEAPKRSLDALTYILESTLILKERLNSKIEEVCSGIVSSVLPDWNKAPECISYTNLMALLAKVLADNSDKFTEPGCKDSVKDEGES